jgi:surface polysaccharide O-acyltransferase-like enzyme
MIHVGASGWYGTPSWDYTWQVMNFWHDLPRASVQIFVMLSGMFHLRPENTSHDFGIEIRKYLRKIFHVLYALVFWGIFYKMFYGNVIELFANPASVFDIHKIIRIPNAIVSGGAHYHLWFLYMIVGLYLITPVVKVFINHATRSQIEYFLIIYFIVGMCIPLYNKTNSVISILPDRLNFTVVELSGYMGYYIAGYYFSKYDLKRNIETGIYILAILSVIFTVFGTAYGSIIKSQPWGVLLGTIMPNTMFETYGVFLLFKKIFKNKSFSETAKKIISHISKYTFGIYLAHDFTIYVLSGLGLTYKSFNPIISVPAICILVMILSYIAAIIVGQIPYLKKHII